MIRVNGNSNIGYMAKTIKTRMIYIRYDIYQMEVRIRQLRDAHIEEDKCDEIRKI